MGARLSDRADGLGLARAPLAVTVRVYHNVAVDSDGRHAGFDGYQPGHGLVLVAEYPVGLPGDRFTDADVYAAAEHAFELFNVGDDPDFGTPDPIAVAYRARRNRSLSVGDVVAVGEAFLAVASSGWEPVDVRPGQLSTIAVHGSAPLEAS